LGALGHREPFLQLDLGVGGSKGERVTKIEEVFLGIVE